MLAELFPEFTSNLSSGTLAALSVGWLIFATVIYTYLAICVQNMAKRLNIANSWLAWIPIANLFLMLMVAGKPLWWFIIILIPLVNTIIFVILWMKIAERLGHSRWYGILSILPVANIVLPGYLAFSSGSPATKV